jgi:hypothetical protein
MTDLFTRLEPSGAKAPFNSALYSARLKPCPFKTSFDESNFTLNRSALGRPTANDQRLIRDHALDFWLIGGIDQCGRP